MPVELYRRIGTVSLHSKEPTGGKFKTPGIPHFPRPSVTFGRFSGLKRGPENALRVFRPLWRLSHKPPAFQSVCAEKMGHAPELPHLRP